MGSLNMTQLRPRTHFCSCLWLTSTVVLACFTGCGGGQPSQTQSSQAASPHTSVQVASTIPANGASGVAFNSAIAVTFTADVDPTTITSNTFHVSNMNGTIAYDAKNRTAVFHPSSTMAPNTTYSAVLTTGIKDTAGGALAAGYSFNFETSNIADVTPPTVQSVFPAQDATNVPLDTKITCTFSEAMDSTGLVGSTSSGVPASLAYDATTFTASMTPTTKLNPSTLYTVTLKGNVRDLAGNQLGADKVWSFTTAPK